LLGGRNHMDASRAEAYAFAGAGVEIVPDRLTHAKCAIADGTRGALFSANFMTHHGLTGGVEVGMRLDDTRALAEAARYFEHLIAEADMTFVRDQVLRRLAESLYADDLTPCPLPPTVSVMVEDRHWATLRQQTGVVLYEWAGED